MQRAENAEPIQSICVTS